MYDLNTWRTITLGACAVGQVTFVVLYLTLPWWKNFLGRALFSNAFILAALVTIAFLGRVFHYNRMDALYVILYSVFAAAIFAQVIAFLISRRNAQGGSR